MTDRIPPSLTRFGVEYDRVVRRELSVADTPVPSRRGSITERGPSRKRRPHARSLLALPPVAAAATAAVLLVTSAGSLPTQAYALTRHADGSVTVTIRNLAHGVPQLNDRLAELGIRAKAIPVTANCRAASDGISLIDFGHPAVGQSARGNSVTIGNADVPAGSTSYVAAERTATGQIALAIGTTRGPLPSCLSADGPADATAGSQGGAARSRASSAAHVAGLAANH
jgi:hypothetical protein